MYIPHTKDEIKEMLQVVGVSSIEELFCDIPEEVKIKEDLDLPSARTEMELIDYFTDISKKNIVADNSFLGAGAYNHFIPAAISHLVSRAEFYTAYTPYQAEISQGILQAIFEYQTLICELTGMDVSNASHYNGATAVAEAALMATAHTGRKKVLVSSALHPDYRQVLNTYFSAREEEVEEIPLSDGLTCNVEINENIAAVIIQSPNFFGCLEDVSFWAEHAHKSKSLAILAITEPFSLGILASPGTMGVDIVAGEGQSFGNPVAFGGPHLGFLACKNALMRKMAGRLVGLTHDHDGKRGFVLTLQTREQHIRRERATSNICSNQALCALAATIYLSYIGKEGFRDMSYQSFQKALYGKKKISELKGYEVMFTAPFYNEFLVKCPDDPANINKFLLEKGIIGGYGVEKYYPHLKNCMLLCFTERNSRSSIDKLVNLLGEAVK